MFLSNSEIVYGDNPNPFVSLQPSVEKIQTDTGWEPNFDFREGLEETQKYPYEKE